VCYSEMLMSVVVGKAVVRGDVTRLMLISSAAG